MLIAPVGKAINGDPKELYSHGCYKPIAHARLVNI